jgi:hypothetical protein
MDSSSGALGAFLFVFLLVFGPALLGIFVFKQKPILLKHKDSGIRKTARLGWSWTYYYFGFLVPIFRGEITIAVLHLVITIFTLGLFQIIWSFLYNKQHMTRLLTSGWILSDSPEVEEFAKRKLGIY